MDFPELNTLEGLQFVPVGANKRPTVKAWQTTRAKYDLSKAKAAGLVCGSVSGNVEAIDIDVKYDLTGKLFDRYKRLIHEMDPGLLSLLVVQRTKNGGFHLIYRCATVEKNQKLANRPTTDAERKETYKATLEEKLAELMPEPKAREEAEKTAKNDKERVLIETRGEGGQIVCYPTPGYEFIHGCFTAIAEITTDQRETLINIARQFNQCIEEYRPAKQEKKQQKGLTPFEDYNDRGDVVALLEAHGWRVVKKQGDKIIFLRPGQTSAASSGNYDTGKKWFSVFTTSTAFDSEKAYQPYAVYTVLECEGNFSVASKKLYDAGYGDRIEKQQEINSKTPSRISLLDDDFSFIAAPGDYENYLQQARSGTLPHGLTTGMPSLDHYFLFKPGVLVVINGIDNVGKTAVILFMAMLSAVLHNWKWVIFCAENSVGFCVRRMIEFYCNKPIRKMNDMEYLNAKKFVENHFRFIKSEDDLYNYKDVVLMAKKILKVWEFDSVLIDPYNALKIELTNASKLSTHEYHYEAMSEIKLFTKQTGKAFYINTHAITAASRLRSDDKKSVLAPQKADVEGGAKFANKADDFLTIHRDVQHPTDWMITEIHVRKIKETESGGQVTPYSNPVKIRMMKGGTSFCEDSHPFEESPIEKWRKANNGQKEFSMEVSPNVNGNGYTNEHLNSLNQNEDPF